MLKESEAPRMTVALVLSGVMGSFLISFFLVGHYGRLGDLLRSSVDRAFFMQAWLIATLVTVPASLAFGLAGFFLLRKIHLFNAMSALLVGVIGAYVAHRSVEISDVLTTPAWVLLGATCGLVAWLIFLLLGR